MPHQPRPVGAGRAGSAAESRPALWLSRIAVSNFRCYVRAELETDGRPVVLAGPNGAGKTNLLEAISYLAPGRGLRRAKLSEVDHIPRPGPGTSGGAPGPRDAWAVAATAMTPEGVRELGTGRDPATNGAQGRPRERRLVKIDGAQARSQQDLGAIMAMVWLSPRMDGLFRDGASARRRFLDRLVYGFDPAHAGRIGAYERALRERARLLKAGGTDNAWLDALEEGMARNGVAIAAARRDLVKRLGEACAARIGPFPVAGLELAGEIEAALESHVALAVEDDLRARLAAARFRDAATGGAAVGPHRDDLSVRHLERDLPAGLCSTGEQKALLISIVLAHARLLALHRGAAPLLLLDEVVAHLDEVRRRALFDEVQELGAQAWLTGTDAAVFAALGERACFFRVREAAVRPIAPPLAS